VWATGFAIFLCSHPAEAAHKRWSIKTGVPSGHSATHGTHFDLADLMALPDAGGVAKNDARYEAKRIPDPTDGHQEGDMVSSTGYLLLVALEDDGDYHIQVGDKPSTVAGSRCLVVEVPPEKASLNANATTRQLAGLMRQWVREKLLRGKEASSSGNRMIHPPYVKVTGQLFYDDSHVGDAPRGKRGIKATTLWEIHPVTVLGFAQKPK
jgi:hypothetical protein